MPLLSVLRFLATLASTAVLAAAGSLLWSWHQGDLVRDAVGNLYRERDASGVSPPCAECGRT